MAAFVVLISNLHIKTGKTMSFAGNELTVWKTQYFKLIYAIR